jgi:hypothetical protein
MRWIIIVLVPLVLFVITYSTVARIQHWPIGRMLLAVSSALIFIVLIVSWVFAIKYKPVKEEIEFDSI